MFQVYLNNDDVMFDRYTIYFWRQDWSRDGTWHPNGCVTTNGLPSEMWQHGDFDPLAVGKNEHQIDVSEMPLQAREQLLKELQLDE
jgi:hypothetical protein